MITLSFFELCVLGFLTLITLLLTVNIGLLIYREYLYYKSSKYMSKVFIQQSQMPQAAAQGIPTGQYSGQYV